MASVASQLIEEVIAHA